MLTTHSIALSIALYVVVRVFVSIDEEELLVVDDGLGTDVKIRGQVVLRELSTEVGLVRLLHAAALEEFAADDAWTTPEKNGEECHHIQDEAEYSPEFLMMGS
jgi:hypothetical protein